MALRGCGWLCAALTERAAWPPVPSRQAMGGRFRSVMPSDLARVGAIARESLPAKGAQYASESNRTELVRFFRRWAGRVLVLRVALWGGGRVQVRAGGVGG
jgi:hypothetical protein